MTCQIEMQFSRPKVTPEMVAQMEQTLLMAAEPWNLAAHLCWLMNLGGGEGGKRIVRELASQSKGKIISGQKGYCHTDRASVEEVRHSAARLFSQAEEERFRAQQQLEAKGLSCS